MLRYFECGAALVFCATREAVRQLHANLVERGFAAVALSGELTQNERTHALQALRDRRARVCVATDVAARGLDLPDLDLVIHADLPTNRETLQHRSGRTGRAGRKGISRASWCPHPRRRRVEHAAELGQYRGDWQSAADRRGDPRQGPGAADRGDPPAAEAARGRPGARPARCWPSARPEEIAAALCAWPAPACRRRRTWPRRAGPAYGRERGASARRLGRDREPATPRAAAPGFEDAVWFRIDLGRNSNAEARWLLPMICRRGHVTKRDIGAIRIFERETRFQIAGRGGRSGSRPPPPRATATAAASTGWKTARPAAASPGPARRRATSRSSRTRGRPMASPRPPALRPTDPKAKRLNPARCCRRPKKPLSWRQGRI